jgi:hypothetical protein
MTRPHQARSIRASRGCARALRILARNAALVLSLALGATSLVHALGLGEIVQQSALGEPLRFAIPVLFNADDLGGDELAPECFRLVSSESPRSAELPQMRFGRAALERNGAELYVVITSNALADDPVLSFTVQAGCKLRIRHEYTVLLDPPLIREPAGEPLPSAVEPARALQLRQAASPAAGAAASAGQRNARTVAVGGGSSPRRAQKTARPAAGGKALPVRSATSRRDEATPRLRVSRGNGEASGAADIARGKSDEEIRRDVEAETVVLQRRVAELSATLERMQTELREATAAREIAERTMKASRPPDWEPSPWLVPLVLLVAILGVAVVLLRVHRSNSLIDLGPTTIVNTGAFEPARSADDPHPTVATPGHVAATLAASDAADVARGAHPVAPNPTTDQDSSFDDDLLHYAEQTSAYSVLEREHPKVVASVIRDWGKPKVIAYLREILVSPRKSMRAFSREAVSDLMMLQGIAMERAGYEADENPWQVEIDNRRTREA